MEYTTHKKIIRRTVFFLLFACFVVYSIPKDASAAAFISPFGGKIEEYELNASGCEPLTAAISAATLGTVNLTVEKLKVGNPKGGTFGILRVDGLTIPGLTTIYKKRTYGIGTWVLGQSINLCDVCESSKNVPILNSVCEIGILKDVLSTVCDFVGESCPVGKLIYKMGTSGLSL